MPRTTEPVTLTLRPETLKAIDLAAQRARRSRSQFVDLTLESALTDSKEDHMADSIPRGDALKCSNPI